MTLIDRSKNAHNAVLKRLYALMEKKQSNLALSLDVVNQAQFFEILERVGLHIVILKTHCDCINDFDSQFVSRLLQLKEKYEFIILEDRKFADIGNTVKLQYTEGVFRIIEWADLITAHIFPGDSMIFALRQAVKETAYQRGCVLIPEMTSRNNLFTRESAQKALEYAKEYSDFVIGFIAPANENSISLETIRDLAWPEFLFFTPGVHNEKTGDQLGQTYISPSEAIMRGSDIVIVGRGIYGEQDTKRAAEFYRTTAWSVLKSRISANSNHPLISPS
jgi:orotidine 5'-phosphate decarboxylase subfamily 1